MIISSVVLLLHKYSNDLFTVHHLPIGCPNLVTSISVLCLEMIQLF